MSARALWPKSKGSDDLLRAAVDRQRMVEFVMGKWHLGNLAHMHVS